MKYDRLGECSPEGLFDNLSRSHFQSQVISVTSDGINNLVVDVIGQVVMLSKSVIITMISQSVCSLFVVDVVNKSFVGCGSCRHRFSKWYRCYKSCQIVLESWFNQRLTSVWFMY